MNARGPLTGPISVPECEGDGLLTNITTTHPDQHDGLFISDETRGGVNWKVELGAGHVRLMREVFAEQMKELEGYEAELETLLGKDLADLNRTAAGAGLPVVYLPEAKPAPRRRADLLHPRLPRPRRPHGAPGRGAGGVESRGAAGLDGHVDGAGAVLAGGDVAAAAAALGVLGRHGFRRTGDQVGGSAAGDQGEQAAFHRTLAFFKPSQPAFVKEQTMRAGRFCARSRSC